MAPGIQRDLVFFDGACEFVTAQPPATRTDALAAHFVTLTATPGPLLRPLGGDLEGVVEKSICI